MSGRRVDAGVAVGGLFAKTSATAGLAGRSADRAPSSHEATAIVRQGVELTEGETSFLRSLSRPARTGQPRTLGSKFWRPACSPRRSSCCATARSRWRASPPATSRR
jgi:hypothetical protein